MLYVPYVPFKINGFDFVLDQSVNDKGDLVIVISSKTPLVDLPIDIQRRYSEKLRLVLDSAYDLLIHEQPHWSKTKEQIDEEKE